MKLTPSQKTSVLIRMRRKASGMEQAEIAEAIGISQPAMSRIENGTQLVNVNHLVAIAKELGVEPAELLDYG